LTPTDLMIELKLGGSSELESEIPSNTRILQLRQREIARRSSADLLLRHRSCPVGASFISLRPADKCRSDQASPQLSLRPMPS
jgi:hypothetical protein